MQSVSHPNAYFKGPARTGRSASEAAGLLLLAVGGFLFVVQTMGVVIPPLAWPWYPTLVGLGLLALTFAAGKPAGPLAVPACITTAAGLLLLGQHVTGRFDTWSWAWLLIFPTSVGAGLWIWGCLAESERFCTVGRWFGLVGLALFGLAALIFERLVPSGLLGRTPVTQTLLPAALIGVGLLLLLRNSASAPTD